MALAGASSEIERTVAGWDGVRACDHRRGGREFRLGEAEIGHVHGDEVVDVELPGALRAELLAAGRADPHKVRKDSVSVSLEDAPSLERAIALLRTSYEHHLRSPQPAAPAPAPSPAAPRASFARRLRRRLARLMRRR